MKDKRSFIKKGCLILVAIPILLILVVYIGASLEDEPLTKEQIHTENIQKLFSEWDGSNITLEKLIKSELNDVDSYKHIETTYTDLDSFVNIRSVFTSKNGFGGVVKSTVFVRSDTLGNITHIHQWFK